ncbi:hypothetical protein FHL06_13180 [Lactobacillus halodurans]|uniref:Pentapeptide repeat-containing protein n=1 Tax=Companilactobacillus halodurans TaxID=2584183 RepID=A0A5P0ZT43_9LACO|nr:hypothetical protein [Companilactobacillus halodurans]
MANLNRLNLKVVHFENDSLKDVSFNENKLSKTIFKNCDLNEMISMRTALKGIDFSDCHFETIDLDQNFIRGLKVNSEQAAFLASYFIGVKVSY